MNHKLQLFFYYQLKSVKHYLRMFKIYFKSERSFPNKPLGTVLTNTEISGS